MLIPPDPRCERLSDHENTGVPACRFLAQRLQPALPLRRDVPLGGGTGELWREAGGADLTRLLLAYAAKHSANATREIKKKAERHQWESSGVRGDNQRALYHLDTHQSDFSLLKHSLCHIWKFPAEDGCFIWVCPLKGLPGGHFTLLTKMQFLLTSKSFFRLNRGANRLLSAT